MTCFSATHTAQAIVPFERRRVWEVLQQPALLADLTPLVDRIEVDGDLWRWQLSGVSALGLTVAPSFSVRMSFEEMTDIWFRHEPQDGASEQAGADGEYHLRDHPDGTHLETSLTVRVDLPLPKAARRAVEPVIRATVKRQGDAFGDNLLAHLQAQEGAAQPVA